MMRYYDKNTAEQFHQISLSRWNVIFLSFLIFVLLAIPAFIPTLFAQTGSWSLGKYEFLKAPSSGPLLKSMQGRSSLSAYSFVGSVGGVAFGAVADPNANLQFQKINLIYNRKKPDGERLSVQIDHRQYRMRIYDWLLIPIARYADSKYNACVSLFGSNSTQQLYDIIYHPAFENTLLGIRLLQADILFFDLNEMWKLPKFSGAYILGKGEILPQKLDDASVQTIQSIMAGIKFQAWVLTDVDVEVRIEQMDKALNFMGEPYYYFWISNFDNYSRQRNLLIKQAKKLRYSGKIREYNLLVSRINTLRPDVRQVSALTNGLKRYRSAVRRYNTAVYDAASATMGYAALFRYVKKRNIRGWNKFKNSIRFAIVKPKVKTPTRWAKPK